MPAALLGYWGKIAGESALENGRGGPFGVLGICVVLFGYWLKRFPDTVDQGKHVLRFDPSAVLPVHEDRESQIVLQFIYQLHIFTLAAETAAFSGLGVLAESVWDRFLT
jgi:hypothetical protein